MKLKSFQIKNYKVIDDTGPVRGTVQFLFRSQVAAPNRLL